VADADGLMPQQPCQRCLADCTPVGKFANVSSGCAPCAASCGTCFGPAADQCLSCRATGDLGFLANSSCVAECANGTYVTEVGGQVTCQDCHPSCETCGATGSAACLTCPATGTPLYDGGACVAACPPNKVASGGACVACHATCATCSSALHVACTSCPYGTVFSAGQCTASCATGLYLAEGCLPCDASCAACYGTASNCTACSTVDSSYRYKHEATCGAACPAAYYADSSATCQPCDGTCAECSGGGAADCLSCPASGTPYRAAGGTCLAACAAGEYPGIANACTACHASCATCDGGTADNCTSCVAPQPYLRGASACVAACPTATFAAAGACVPCDATCAECSGAGAASCTSCRSASGYPHLAGGACTCSSGYAATSDACTEINECTAGTDNCHAQATYYLLTTYLLLTTYYLLLTTYNCHAQATCTNLAGTFNCTCVDGYTGDGVTCADIDECALGTHACDTSPSPVDGSALATCTNAAGGYTCACTTGGYAGDGFYCADVNECTLSTHDCHADGTCSNTYGNWSCSCDAGYEGNGAAWLLTPPDA
jgi:proprotein convertase subtilisin/kexin type 5